MLFVVTGSHPNYNVVNWVLERETEAEAFDYAKANDGTVKWTGVREATMKEAIAYHNDPTTRK